MRDVMTIIIGRPQGFMDLGRRAEQQDAIFPDTEDFSINDNFFIICDGMGGHSHGGVASNTIVNSIIRNYALFRVHGYSIEAFNLLLEKAWEELDAFYNADLGERQMGTTLAFLAFTDKGYLAAHIGDSRIYHVRPERVTQFIYKSSDHSQAAELIEAGVITQLDSLSYENKNILNKAIVPHKRYQPEIYEGNDVKKGDYFMLCSDGVYENLTDEMIRFIYSPYRNIDEITSLIHQHCISLSNDNNSCIIIPVIDTIDEESVSTFNNNVPNLCKQWKDDALLRDTIIQYSNN